MYKFENTLPRESEKAMIELQNFLLEEAEKRFGRRDTSKTIWPPKFGDGPPYIVSYSNYAGAFLSKNASGYWQTALYELAHETVHLLNPIIGDTNYLEEGIAVAFSVDLSESLTNHPMSPNDEHYSLAWSLVKNLPDDINASVKKIRDKSGHDVVMQL